MDTHHANEITSGKQAEMTNNFVAGQPVRKNTRIPKISAEKLDGDHDEDDDGEEASQRKISRNTKKRVPVGEYEEDEEGHEDAEIVDAELEGKKKRSRRKQEVGNSTFDDKKEAPLTACQGAM